MTNNAKFSTRRNWRPATFTEVDGARGVVRDKWNLLDAANQPVARIALEQDGEAAGRWRWFIFIHPHGSRLGETGLCDTEEEAREICESRVPDWAIARLPHGRRRKIY